MNSEAWRWLIAAIIGAVTLSANAARADSDADDQSAYQVTNLVSDIKGEAPNTDANLKNPWGATWFPGGPLWISDNNAGVATLYDGQGNTVPLVVTIPGAGGAAGAPSGNVWNPVSFQGQFVIPGSTAAAIFIFVGEDGIISAWNPAVDPITPMNGVGKSMASVVHDNSAGGAVYKGLAFGSNVHGNFIFATNFNAGTVEAYNSNFKLTKLDGVFSDPDLPAGFAPFGIANVDNNLFVTYARQDAAKHDPVSGAGEGFVDVFSTDGVLIRRFASRGTLNAPWGVTRATEGFGRFSGDVLIGNFGEEGAFAGWINAFDNRGQFLGELRTADGHPIAIPGLWALYFGSFLASDGDTLYLTAGINHEADGLIAKITPVPGHGDDVASNAH
jgi:uncharacterized protein (TIGR03118 family)